MKLKSEQEITTPNYTIKQLLPDQVTSDYLNWFSDTLIQQFILNPPTSLKELIEYAAHHEEKDDSILFGIYSNNRHIGNIKFEPISIKEGSAVLGVMIGDTKYRGKGLFAEIISPVSQFLLDQFEITKIYLGVDLENERAIKAYKKSGFHLVKDNSQPFEAKKECMPMLLNLS